MKVCHLSTAHRALDVRIFYKECRSLRRVGFTVTLIAQHPRDEVREGIKIIALPKPQGRLQRMLGSTWRVFQLARQQQADLYHFHDPELIGIGVLLKCTTRKRVVYDVHENMTTAILDKHWIRSQLIRKIIASFFSLMEKVTAKVFDRIIVATPHIGRHFTQSRTVLVRNFPELSLIPKQPARALPKGTAVVLYAGNLERQRGILSLVQAMEYLAGRVKLQLVGEWFDPNFQAECQAQAGWSNASYLGRRSLEETYALMAQADIGMVPLLPTASYLVSLPIKLFEYMACGLPVIAADFPYWQELVGDGIVYCNPQDPSDMADKIGRLLDHPMEMARMSAVGRAMVEQNFNWPLEGERLIEAYRTMLYPRQSGFNPSGA